MSKYKIKINCTKPENLSYNTDIKISRKNKEKYNFDNINYIDEVYILHRTILKNKNKKKFTLKTLEFKINKVLDINEIREFIIILQNKGFKSINNIQVEIIDITDNNNYVYLYKIRYNTFEIDNYIDNYINEKRKSKYSQEEIFKR